MIGLHMPKQSFISQHLLEKGSSGPMAVSGSCALDARFSPASNTQTTYTDNQICYSTLGCSIESDMIRSDRCVSLLRKAEHLPTPGKRCRKMVPPSPLRTQVSSSKYEMCWVLFQNA